MAGDARLFVPATLDRPGEAHGHEVARLLDQVDRSGTRREPTASTARAAGS